MQINLQNVRLREGVEFDALDYTLIAPDLVRTGTASWEPGCVLNLPLNRDMTPSEIEDFKIRIASANDNETTLRKRAAAALNANRNYAAIADTATAAEVRAHVKVLNQENTAILRLLLGLLDGTD